MPRLRGHRRTAQPTIRQGGEEDLVLSASARRGAMVFASVGAGAAGDVFVKTRWAI
jgi:hypothetical protein